MISHIINNIAVQLQLPKNLHIHPVFHISLLKPKNPDAVSVNTPTRPDPIIIDDQPEFVVEAILDSKLVRNTIRYLVHWKGYDNSERTWEPLRSLTNCDRLLSEFHQANPTKPSSSSRISRRNSEGGS
jgi:hypothetical protein